MDYQNILNNIKNELIQIPFEGEVASYIPELARVDPNAFGMHLSCIDGRDFGLGEYEEPFSIQSISKVFSLALAFDLQGDSLWSRVGVEPSGNPFNSLVQLEYENGIPRNPLINPGAIVISDILISSLKQPKNDYLDFIRSVSGDQSINFNPVVAESERKHGYRNRALINLMKSFGNIHNDLDEVLDFYFHACSLEMSCSQLSHAFLVFSNAGKLVGSNKPVLSETQTKRINAIMQTCGFYDEAGEFSFKVGLPGKSGVGGGIAAVYPGFFSVAVWSPRLNEKGNSFLGMKALELLTTKTGSSIF